MFSTSDPIFDPTMQNQEKLSSVTDEEIIQASKYEFQWYHRLFQVICFTLTLGPLRIGIGVFCFFYAVYVSRFFRWIFRKLHLNFEFGKKFCFRFVQWTFRIYCFSLGIIWTKVKGTLDKEARFLISNHISVMDSFIFLKEMGITPVMKSEVQSVKLLEHVLECVDPVYVNRDKQCNQSAMLIERANNPIRYPVLLFPEGAISGAKFIPKFHRSSFLTPHKVQPVLLRYHMPFVPSRWNTYCWADFSFWEHIWDLASMPFSYITLEFLPVIQNTSFEPNDVELFAQKTQIMMANGLGMRAVEQDNHYVLNVLKEFDKNN